MWKHRHSGSLPKLICFTRLFLGSAASTISCKVTRSVARMVTMMTVVSGHLGHEDAEQGGEADGLAGAVLGQRQSDVVEPGVGDGALLAAAVAQLAGQQPSERGLGGHSLTIQLSAGLGDISEYPDPEKAPTRAFSLWKASNRTFIDFVWALGINSSPVCKSVRLPGCAAW